MTLFETSHLHIRHLKPEDTDSMYAIFSLPEVTRWMGNGETLSRDLCEKWIQVSLRNYETKGFGASAVIEKESGRFIGCSGIVYDAERNEPEIIYAFHPNAWGKGYASELVPAMLDYGLNQCGLSYILATIAADNKASAHVVEKAGMKFIREESNPDGHMTLVYQIDPK
ncbi:MAG: GNAT family N-acetyltransferase [Anaerolineales bacterium]|nr:GNAT family N-acetyltransferase [Anaerolineales bacterium]